MKKFLFIAILFIVTTSSYSQSLIRCATTEYEEQVMSKDPYYTMMRQQLEDALHLMDQLQSNHTEGVITIPVVVHILYSNTLQNLADSQIISQIEVLNEDFRKLNADTVNTPAQFKFFAADTEIEFCLASRDPQGNPTDGIVRTSTNKSQFSIFSNDIKFSSMGGSDAWPAGEYLNVWVGNISSGILGYAQPPGGNPATDGVVIDYAYFGRTSNVTGPYSGGRTATHEVGHWLSLRHIWGDGGCGVDDQVNDTPLSDAANYGCPTTHISCFSLDMVQNYMDYTDDACMNLFTQGQKTRMLNTIFQARPSLLTSLGCVAPTSPPIVDFALADSIACVNTLVEFTDNSFLSPTTYEWLFPGGNPATSTVANPSVTYSSTGTYQVTLIGSNAFGSDTVTKNISVVGANASIPVFEGFESPVFPPVKWSIYNPNNDRTWARSTLAGGYGNSSASIYIDNFSPPDPSGKIDLFISARFDLTSAVEPYIKFDRAYARKNPNSPDSLILYYSLDCGESFVPFWAKSGTALATAPDQGTSFVPAPSQWATDSVSLDFLIGEPNVAIALGNKSDYGNNLYLDNILIAQKVISPPVAAIGTSQTSICEGESILFEDQSANTPLNWQWTFTGGTPSLSSSQAVLVTYNNPGTYTVKLKVSNYLGADSIEQLSYITVHPEPTATLTTDNVKCYGEINGSITANPSGGTPPYSYFWFNGLTTQTIGGLGVGNYSVTVSDANLCSVERSATITQPPILTINLTSTPETDGQSNGTASVGVLGGTPPYNYIWNNGQTTSTITGLKASFYTVTVTDANNCVRTANVQVKQMVGIEDHVLIHQLNIYPNPATEILNIDIELDRSAEINIEILNALGQLVFSSEMGRISKGKEAVGLKNISTGVYFIHIRIDDVIVKEKIIVLKE